MALNYALLLNLTAREMISPLVREGFSFDRGSGSHQIHCHHGAGTTFTPKALT